jgi:hypothetical protein
MIILDTNVVSEVLRPQCDARVLAWLDAQFAETLYLTAINAAELWAGVAIMPVGAKKTALEDGLDALLDRLFEGRRLAFDDRAARSYAALMQKARSQGLALPLADGLIAAIASVHGFTVASRDVSPFQAAGGKVINPWEYQGAA